MDGENVIIIIIMIIKNYIYIMMANEIIRSGDREQGLLCANYINFHNLALPM